MWPNEVEYLARKERQQELLREAEREQLAQQANSEADGQGLRQAAGWIGNQMVKWGTKLQDYGTGASKKDEA